MPFDLGPAFEHCACGAVADRAMAAFTPGVTICDGATASTRIPWAPSSSASCFVRPIIPCFEAT